MDMKSVKKRIRTALVVFLVLIIVGILSVAGINIYMVSFANRYNLTAQEASQITDADCIMVLGCGVRGEKRAVR